MAAAAAPNDNSTAKYVIFAMIFGTAFGNMFLAGRIRNVMNIKMPHMSRSVPKTAKEKADAQAQYEEVVRRNIEWEQMRSGRARPAAARGAPAAVSNGFPAWLLADPTMPDHLKALNLWPVTQAYAAFLPDLKRNYRLLAKDCHPDTLPPQADQAARAERSRQFQEIAASYQTILTAVKAHDPEVHHHDA